ncbi:YEL048C-like protein [Saccharomyces cerevisiae x Saccharomyces kudriavzevii VIN7]|uniref:YEL048C-like protein n=1 Tax=Saccharomyces cerevisiae x Saccharomyces kudriavzevii (strain VIN7) TaxID=1095631 RepID=H0GTM1_SACCK|nr:YEL048C-like protein [Saccharomyces cerevisiae x Saccharomyces kudriavzevii VIN7]
MSLVPCFISLIDAFNKPILIYVPRKAENEVNDVLKYNVLSNISLDYFESSLIKWTSLDSKPSLKSIFQLEGISVFGMLIKQTGLKMVIGFEQTILNGGDDELKTIDQIFETVRRIYVRVKCNPLLTDGDEVTAVKSLERKFDEIFISADVEL